MTLVVARISGARIAIAGDTRVSLHGDALPVSQGVIKSCLFTDKDLCVSFANSPELAERDLAQFVTEYRGRTEFGRTLEFFERSSKMTGNDYLLACSTPPRIVKIADGKRQKSLSKTVWIGDASGYKAFREFESRARSKYECGRAINAVLFADELANSPASDLYSVMRHVVSDRAVPAVGGFVSVVSNRPEGFRFSVYSDMLYDWPDAQPDDYEYSNLDKTHLNASGENSGYSVSQLASEFVGANLVGFYFVRTHSLFLFVGQSGGLANQCFILRNVPPQDVPTALAQRLGFDFRWLALVTSAPDKNSLADLGLQPRPSGEHYGASMGFFCHLNTFPKP
jgi:hypothetical protein